MRRIRFTHMFHRRHQNQHSLFRREKLQMLSVYYYINPTQYHTVSWYEKVINNVYGSKSLSIHLSRLRCHDMEHMNIDVTKQIVSKYLEIQFTTGKKHLCLVWNSAKRSDNERREVGNLHTKRLKFYMYNLCVVACWWQQNFSSIPLMLEYSQTTTAVGRRQLCELWV